MILTTIWISLVASIISLDVTACWQVMISRPIIIGPLIGWMCGDFTHGMIMGSILELIWINTLPLGASIPLDAAATTVVATASSVFLEQWWKGGESTCIVLGICYALPLGTIIKKLDIFVRRFSNQLVYYADKYAKQDNLFMIQAMVIMAIILIIIKYFLFYFISIYLGLYVFHMVVPRLPDYVLAGLGQAKILLIALGLAMVWDTFRFRKVGKEA
ncbi:MAG: PTS sugar transporter subunit IIC [bacterium]|nr:PTS sugar transporter subunit IIC [bacterium]MDD5755744.1 PTS sugar transporter subunit IIC [bacterium]